MTESIGSEIEHESNAEIAECTVGSVASVNGDGCLRVLALASPGH